MKFREPRYWQQCLHKHSLQDREHTNKNANSVLIPGKWAGSDSLATILNQNDLDGDGADDDQQEEGVVEESGEHVVLVDTELTGIDFVEDLHHDESIEEHGVMLNFLRRNGISSDWVIGVQGLFISVSEVEDLLSSEEIYYENCSLEESLTNNVSPHDSSDDEFVS